MAHSVLRIGEAAVRDQRWDRLVAWYLAHRRALPWRDRPTPYRVWISEVMLQQTQVATVLPYFQRWMKRFPTVEALADASLNDVLSMWAGLGYYRRARNLHDAAKAIAARLAGSGRKAGWPLNREEWLALPGVGRYTAGAICSIALGQQEPIVDGNVERVFSRMFRLANLDRVWEVSESALAVAAKKSKPGDFNQALMELGATVCTPRNPLCKVCPLSSKCKAFLKGEVEKYPHPKQRAPIRQVTEHVLCCVDPARRRVLLVKGRGKWRAGLWDFPRAIDVKAPSSSHVGVGEMKYAVTVHRVRRKYTIAHGARSTFGVKTPLESRWVGIDAPDVPVGAPVSKLLLLLK